MNPVPALLFHIYTTQIKKNMSSSLEIVGHKCGSENYFCAAIHFRVRLKLSETCDGTAPSATHRKTGILNNSPSRTSSLASSACANDISHHSISLHKALHYNAYKPRFLDVYLYNKLTATLAIQVYTAIPRLTSDPANNFFG